MDFGPQDLVYFDPKTQAIIGPVEWTKAGLPKPLAMKEEEEVEDAKGKRHRRKRTYPWGTVRSLERVLGKKKEKEPVSAQVLDEALDKATKEPFWD
ncbi:TPA: hypothetical protein DCL30_03100 [Candidatus Peribacteria bacterium]|nr:MAG: hypothetical protein A3J91_00360 [Candidatus Peribacteria bacterium RIFOXYC2_FULL_58_10]OGJ83793.1 MAG: hypothetical protein A2529_05610 [Candidatus Peribacteria bacterium RIFOXYD2_FULL_58_15]HAI98507.1 hypothetical protein [Candidatus Peribacteria bacterium]HAS34219.1 hypothetical protein [Candidatus Peribacteria bacterium]